LANALVRNRCHLAGELAKVGRKLIDFSVGLAGFNGAPKGLPALTELLSDAL